MIHDKMLPWRMAQFRKAVMPYVVAPLMWWNIFLDTWDEVRYGRDPASKTR